VENSGYRAGQRVSIVRGLYQGARGMVIEDEREYASIVRVDLDKPACVRLFHPDDIVADES
jgi:hypothetical protein